MRKVEAAECLEGGDADGSGKVKGAQWGVGECGDGEALWVADEIVEPLRGSVAFVAEEEAIALCVGGVPERRLCFGGEKPEAGGGEGRGDKGVKIVMDMDIEVVPVVHTGAAQVAVGDVKAEGADQVKAGVDPCAEASDIAGILRNFGIKEDDVQVRLHQR